MVFIDLFRLRKTVFGKSIFINPSGLRVLVKKFTGAVHLGQDLNVGQASAEDDQKHTIQILFEPFLLNTERVPGHFVQRIDLLDPSRSDSPPEIPCVACDARLNPV